MKALFFKISLVATLCLSMVIGNAQQQGAVQVKNKGGDKKVESVVVKEKVATAERVVLDAVWFLYDGDGPFNDPNNYSRSPLGDGDIEEECPDGPDELCAIKVEPASTATNSLPNASALQAMQSQITGTLDTTNPSSNVILKEGESR